MNTEPRPDRPVVAIVGAGGVGAASAVRFAAGGWNVAVIDIDSAAASRVAASVSGHAIAADVRIVADCDRAIDGAAAWGGRLDALVNAAGVWREGPSRDVTEDDWDTVIDINLKGTFFMCRAAIDHLAATSGVIVNLSSDAGVQGNRGAAVYSASKGAVTNLTRALALELAPQSVRVNAVCPGDIDTAMLQFQAERYGHGDPDGYYRRLLDAYPQGDRARFIRSDEVAELIWFLCQPHAAAITGANLSIDFGLSAGI